MEIKRFENIESWKEARLLVSEVYHCLSNNKDWSFRDQMQRAALSIMSNIAEGFDRGTNKEFIQFLVIARGSASEVKSIAYAGLDLGYIGETEFKNICQRCITISKLLNGFIRFLKSSGRKS